MCWDTACSHIILPPRSAQTSTWTFTTQNTKWSKTQLAQQNFHQETYKSKLLYLECSISWLVTRGESMFGDSPNSESQPSLEGPLPTVSWAFSGSWSCCRSLNTTTSKERLLNKGFIVVINCKLPSKCMQQLYICHLTWAASKIQENNWQLWKQGYLYGRSRCCFLCNQGISYKKVPNVKDFKGSYMNLPACLSYRRLAVTLVMFKGEGASEPH